MAAAFFIIGSYEIARASVESVFLEVYGPDWLPWAWVMVGLASAGAVELYGRAAARMPLGRVLGAAALVSAAVLGACLLGVSGKLPGAAFALYVWKDVYVVVLIEAFWSRANARFRTEDAKSVYGVLTASGSLAGVVCGAAVGPLASALGTTRTLSLLIPWLGALGLVLLLFSRDPEARAEVSDAKKPRGGLVEGLRTVWSSRYLTPLLGLILTTQLVITLVDWLFSAEAGAAFPDTDVRTGVIGQVYAGINAGAFVLQLGTGLVIGLLGVRGVLAGIPLVLGAAVAGHVVVPVFAFAAASKVASKVFDYSIFRAAKEMLYIPLGRAEKAQGKAVVDMLTYRSAKAGAAALVGVLVAVASTRGVEAVIGALLVVWVGLALLIGGRYRETLVRADSRSGDEPIFDDAA